MSAIFTFCGSDEQDNNNVNANVNDNDNDNEDDNNDDNNDLKKDITPSLIGRAGVGLLASIGLLIFFIPPLLSASSV